MTRILVIGDLHGIKPKIWFKDFDFMICTGDFCSSKFMGKIYKDFFKLRKTNPSLVFEDYLYKAFTKKELKIIDRKSLADGREVLEFLNSFNKPVFIVPGNWDQSYGKTQIKDINRDDYTNFKAFFDFWNGTKTNSFLIKGLNNIYDCQFKIYKQFGFNILGYGLSSGPEYVFSKKGRSKDLTYLQKLNLLITYKRLYRRLNKIYNQRDKSRPTIFLTHNIPYNTKLDIIKNKDSVAYNQHTGSSIARDFCEKNKPFLCVGGHVHEHHGKDKIGKTLVINGGFGKNANTLIEIDDKTGKVKRINFVK